VISGRVTAELEVLVPIRLLRPDGPQHLLDIGVDTGFTGHIVLPSTLLAAISAPRVGSRTAMLADGGQVSMDAHLVEVVWAGQPRKLLALNAEGRAMMGLSLLYGHKLSLEVTDDGAVLIERLP
jgi:clan AA aspartic protease